MDSNPWSQIYSNQVDLNFFPQNCVPTSEVNHHIHLINSYNLWTDFTTFAIVNTSFNERKSST